MCESHTSNFTHRVLGARVISTESPLGGAKCATSGLKPLQITEERKLRTKNWTRERGGECKRRLSHRARCGLQGLRMAASRCEGCREVTIGLETHSQIRKLNFKDCAIVITSKIYLDCKLIPMGWALEELTRLSPRRPLFSL